MRKREEVLAMTNHNMLMTATKNLAKHFLPNVICKVEYSTNVLNRRHNYRDMIKGRENGISPIYNSVEAGYVMPILH